MALSIAERRAKLAELYSESFVSSKDDRQIAAIYESCLSRGYFNKRHKKQESSGYQYYQMTLFDCGMKKGGIVR